MLYFMTGYPVFLPNASEILFHGFAVTYRNLTTGMEGATAWGINWARDITFENDSFTSAIYDRIWDGYRGQKGDGIGVQRVFIKLVTGRNLNNFSKVHYCNTFADVAHHRKIV